MKQTKEEPWDENGDSTEGGIFTADWKAHPNDMLELFDKQLAEFGLEICEYETHGDFYAWKIVKRGKNDNIPK